MTVPLAAIPIASGALAQALAADAGLGQTSWLMQWGGGGGPAPPVFPPLVSGTQPTIAADFAGNQYWASGVIQPDFATWFAAVSGTFTRASTATYFDGGVLKTAAVNALRFPTNLNSVPRGIRLTGPATNIALQSNTYNVAPWTGLTGTVVQNAVGPDGVANSAWTFTSGGGQNRLKQAMTPTAPNVMSWFVKPGTERFAYFNCSDGAGLRITWFDLVNGVVASSNVPTTAPTNVQSNFQITPLANGWFLISLQNSGALIQVTIGFSSADGDTTEPTAGLTAFAFGFQVTNTPFLQDYVPTAAASATQAGDMFTTTRSITPTQLTRLQCFTGPPTDTVNDQNAWGHLAGAITEGIHSFCRANFGTVWTQMSHNSTNAANLNSNVAPIPGAQMKHAYAVQVGSLRQSVNGSAITSSAPASIAGTMTTEYIGSWNGSFWLNSNLQSISEWTVFASDAELQRITT